MSANLVYTALAGCVCNPGTVKKRPDSATADLVGVITVHLDAVQRAVCPCYNNKILSNNSDARQDGDAALLPLQQAVFGGFYNSVCVKKKQEGKRSIGIIGINAFAGVPEINCNTAVRRLRPDRHHPHHISRGR